MDKNANFSTTFTSEDAVPSHSSLSKNWNYCEMLEEKKRFFYFNRYAKIWNVSYSNLTDKKFNLPTSFISGDDIPVLDYRLKAKTCWEW